MPKTIRPEVYRTSLDPPLTPLLYNTIRRYMAGEKQEDAGCALEKNVRDEVRWMIRTRPQGLYMIDREALEVVGRSGVRLMANIYLNQELLSDEP